MRVTKVTAPPRPTSSRTPLGGLTLPKPGWRKRAKAERKPAPGPVVRALGPRAEKRIRRLAAAAVGVILIFALGLPGMAIDAISRAAIGTSAILGLTVEEVLLDGRVRSDAQAVRAALKIELGEPLLAYDIDNAMRRLERLPWVASAAVERRLPDAIHVTLTEREPLALWQPDDETVLVVDREGVVVDAADPLRYGHLPLLVGAGATESADELFALLAGAPDIAGQIAAAIRVGARRWDLRLNQGVTLRLPETEPAAALTRFAVMEAEHGLLDRALEAVDLRDPERTVIRAIDSLDDMPVTPLGAEG